LVWPTLAFPWNHDTSIQGRLTKLITLPTLRYVREAILKYLAPDETPTVISWPRAEIRHELTKTILNQ
jgi:hypothetical protein